MFGKLNKLNASRELKQPVNEVESLPSHSLEEMPATVTVSAPEGVIEQQPTIPPLAQQNPPNDPINEQSPVIAQGDMEHIPDVLSSEPVSQSTSQSIEQSTSRPIGQSTSQSTRQSTTQSTTIFGNRIVSRPKAFYITERLDARLDEAVRYLQEQHGIRKIDRSTIVNALLDNEANWTPETLDLLVDRVLRLLASRLTS